MRKALFRLGLLGCGLATGMGLFGFGFSFAAHSTGLRAASLAVPLTAFVGVLMARLAPGFASLLMLMSSVGLLLVFGFNVVSAMPFALIFLSSLMAAAVALANRRDEMDVF